MPARSLGAGGSLVYDYVMVAFGHTAVGAVIGIISYQALGQGDIALGLISTGLFGWFSHYLADLIPHGHFFRDDEYNKKINWVIIFDLIAPFVFLLALAHYSGRIAEEILYIIFAVGGAQLPDVLVGLIRIGLLPEWKILKIENKYHFATHWHGKGKSALIFSIKDIWQLLFYALAVLLIIKS